MSLLFTALLLIHISPEFLYIRMCILKIYLIMKPLRIRPVHNKKGYLHSYKFKCDFLTLQAFQVWTVASCVTWHVRNTCPKWREGSRAHTVFPLRVLSNPGNTSKLRARSTSWSMHCKRKLRETNPWNLYLKIICIIYRHRCILWQVYLKLCSVSAR